MTISLYLESRKTWGLPNSKCSFRRKIASCWGVWSRSLYFLGGRRKRHTSQLRIRRWKARSFKRQKKTMGWKIAMNLESRCLGIMEWTAMNLKNQKWDRKYILDRRIYLLILMNNRRKKQLQKNQLQKRKKLKNNS